MAKQIKMTAEEVSKVEAVLAQSKASGDNESRAYHVAANSIGDGGMAHEDEIDLIIRRPEFFDLPPRQPGEKSIARRRWAECEAEVAELNAAYAVAHLGGDVVILHEHADPATGDSVVDFMKPEAMRLWFADRSVPVENSRGETRNRPLFDHWKAHAQRRSYTGIVFEPRAPGAPPDLAGGLFNWWRGWAVAPNPRGAEGCALFLRHLREVVCDGNEERYEWLVGWLADAVQNPDARPGTSVILRGGQGSGKSLVGHYVGAMYGSHYVYLGDRQQLTGRFNKVLQNALMVLGDELIFGGDHAAANKLKSIVTEPTIMIEPKFVDPFPVRNHARLILATNEESIMPTGRDDRRYFMAEVSGRRTSDRDYFDALVAEMRGDGPACLLHHLAHLDISGVDVKRAPKTEALADQKARSMNPEQKWWFDRLTAGQLVDEEYLVDPSASWQSGPIRPSRGAAYQAYLDSSRERNVRSAATEKALWSAVDDMCLDADGKRLIKRTERMKMFRDWKDDARDGVRHRKGRFFIVPKLADCRAAFDRWCGQEVQWDDSDTDDNPQQAPEPF